MDCIYQAANQIAQCFGIDFDDFRAREAEITYNIEPTYVHRTYEIIERKVSNVSIEAFVSMKSNKYGEKE